jgi:hypothetical protein
VDRKIDDLQSLPAGLWQYYARYWLAWRADHPEEWDDLHLPMLAALGAARETVSRRALAALVDGCQDLRKDGGKR